MKKSPFLDLVKIVCFLTFSLSLPGCFGGGIDPKDDPVQPSSEGEAANAGENNNAEEAGLNNAEENNTSNLGNNNFAENNGGGGNNANGGQGEDEAVNNAANENFLNAENANAESNLGNQGNNNLFGNQANKNANLNNNNLGLNDGAEINGAEQAEAPANSNGGNNIIVDQGATDPGLAAPEDSGDSILAPVAQNPTAPATSSGKGAVVRYVMQNGAKAYDRPQGESVRELEQGDHPLVSEEGEWSRSSDGYYIPAASLTPSPVGRFKRPKEWR